MFYLHLAAILALAVVARFLFLLLPVDKMRYCLWCAPWTRRDGQVRPPWWAPWCLRCRGRREHFRLGARTTCRVRAALREAWREERARRAARNAIGRPEDDRR